MSVRMFIHKPKNILAALQISRLNKTLQEENKSHHSSIGYNHLLYLQAVFIAKLGEQVKFVVQVIRCRWGEFQMKLILHTLSSASPCYTQQTLGVLLPLYLVSLHWQLGPAQQLFELVPLQSRPLACNIFLPLMDTIYLEEEGNSS